MILYFANRQMEIQGRATTHLRKGFVITEDLKTEDVESGVAVFDCKIGYNSSNRKRLESMTVAGNYILRQSDGETEFYTIIDREIDTKSQSIYVYAEDAGLDLLNEIAEAYAATEAHPASWYIEKWIIDSGFEIGINEIPSTNARKLSWDGEATVTERLSSIATQFGGYEISFSFAIKGMEITNKYVNIYAERGKNTDEQLRLNRDIDRIIVKESVANLATALRCTGGMLEDGETYIDLKGYEYDDGDFYVSADGILRSRNAVAKWSRYVWNKEPGKLDNYAGHIIRTYSYDTLSQSTLCAHAVTELKKICDVEINYEIDIKKLPESIKIGDRINIVDADGELYLSSRILKLETSATENTQTATIGEHLIKEGGISLKVEEMATKFAETAKSAARAQAVADAAKTAADDAKRQAGEVYSMSEAANQKADEAKAAASAATQSAAAAQSAANEAAAAVESVEKSVESIGSTIENAQTAAQQAQNAASEAQAKANQAEQSAAKALADAADAKAQVVIAQTNAETAISNAEAAQSEAATAKSEANTAKATAEAAKQDAAKASEDISNLGKNLDTISQTMEADYARKTDLTEAEAHLQTQITQNAGQISSTAAKVVEIDETANNAAQLAGEAQAAASSAQLKAAQATADAENAQNAAEAAASAAEAAQSEADTAKAAADTAKSVADKAEADLEAAKADLATVQSRVDATEEEIEAAEKAVEAAQTAANTAKADAATAAQNAAEAQTTANTAKTNAESAQATASSANTKAEAAQAAANAAKGDATAAQKTANEAKANAEAAQTTANTAKTNAETAQSKADAAAQEASAAQSAAEAADAKAQAAAADLATAQSNLAAVTSRVDATEEEIAAAEEAVAAAQSAASEAAADAAAAQSTANTAKTNAEAAQTVATNAKTAADNAQKAADDAQDAADAAQAAVDSLAQRVTTAETKITQNAEQIALRATKTEVTQTFGGYYNKTQTDALIKVESDKIASQVTEVNGLKSRMSTIEQTAEGLTVELENLSVGGRNLIADTSEEEIALGGYPSSSYSEGKTGKTITAPTKNEYVLSFEAKSTVANDKIVCHFFSPNTTTKVESSTGFTGTSADGRAEIILSTAWKKYYVKYTQDGASTTTQKNWIVGRRTAGHGTGSISIRSIKLEEGNIATTWTPAPEDVSGDISTAQTSANNAATSASNAQSTANAANSTANSVQTDLANNYTKKTLPDTRSANETPQWYITNYPKQIITEFKGASTIGLSGETYCTLETVVPWTDSSGGWPKQTAKIGNKEYWRIGTSATTWGGWNDASATATNFLSYDATNGLLIGNKSSGSWSGSRAQILPSAFNILDSSGAILASYSANTIELGKNSEQTQIKLCNGKGMITASDTDFANGTLVFESDNIQFSGYAARMYATRKTSNTSAYTSSLAAYPLETRMSYQWSNNLESDGTGIWNSNTITLDMSGMYSLCDRVQMVSRSEFIISAVGSSDVSISGENVNIGGTLNTTSRIKAQGGLRLNLGGQITALNSGGQEMTMLQMNADNYTMLGYGSYLNKIGRTYVDGNAIYMRSQGDIDITGATKINGTLTVTGNFTATGGNATLTAIELYRATPYIDFHYGNSTADYTSRIIEDASGRLSFLCTAGVRLGVTNEKVGLYTSSSSTYSAHFRPDTDAKCTLGIAANRWYAVYASNASIQTSDRREKENIKPFGLPEMMITEGETKLVDLHSELFDRLQPVQYNMINGSGKTCFGLIAQDVVESMREIGIGEDDLDLVHHDFWTDEESGDTKESYGLAYTNLIAMLIHEVQKLKTEIATMKG